ncbi:GlsB/YeaQ/YmgE family stress response membrane protein [Vulcaniibacterium gelatinicum]|uniref:GlsB/YeaQ/YmgE family stress response membrane protein n=1 Tax=Vulcaniibacterium gelatinicum TaxID=2598725 RepID=UPI0011CCD3E1|nr:GlsB/YeaQ/YmgE family stress response membrane protein [Vulcaniibacterium gelatinicum]
MSLIIWLVVGGIVGWLASLIMKTDAQQGIVLNVVVGVLGGVIGGWLLPRVGLSLGGGMLGFFVTALIGAIVLLAVVNLFRRGRPR